MTLVDALATLAALALALPALVFVVECAVAARAGEVAAPPAASTPRPRTVVVIPAHDEERGIAATVTALRPLLGPADRLLVVADNCADATAAAARAAGAEVIERRDPERRGKGYAIAFAVDALAPAPPDVVVIVDADCRMSPDGLAILAREATATNRPVQAEYLMAAPERPTPKTTLSGLAVLVRNRVRPLGLHRLGLPTHLTGSGMAFPWGVLRAAPNLGSNLVEDLVLGLELALAGHAPLMCPAVRVSSELPEGDEAALGQRRRWEHGQLATLRQYGPRMIMAGLRRGSADLLALGLDLCVPPLALLVTLLGGAAAAALALALLGGGSRVPFAVTALALAGVGLAVLGAWARFGRDRLPLRHLVLVPVYVLWKLPLYVSFVARGKHKSWDRTRRQGEAERPHSDPLPQAGEGDQ
jgi:cellulose synthase/poly-beta-1,6-N-acetylglucosamine synthase-like glycosyltransferase